MSESAESRNGTPQDMPRKSRPMHTGGVLPSNVPDSVRPSAIFDTRQASPSRECEAASIDTDKTALRRIVLARRDAIDADTRARKSSRICDALMNEILLGADAGGKDRPRVNQGRTGKFRQNDGVAASIAPDCRRPTVAVYAAFGSEVDPSAFTQVAELAGWCVAYPCMLPRGTAAECGQRICMRAVCRCDRAVAPFLANPTRAFAELDIDSARFPIVPADELDAIIVPLVAFDARGMRLGYGGGCYDRYLPTLSATCKILGIAFAEQQVAHAPADEHDLPLPRIITA